MALDDMAASDDMGLGGEEPTEPMDEFETEIRAAFPDNDWSPDRVMAMKEAIRLCLEEDKSGGYDDEKPAGPPAKGGSGLALIFGGPKKKGG
ncbi:MAG TPA: hypothetical protein VFZ53_22250 [Polyangiaceae bacterium]